MATCDSVSEWPRASISLLGLELITRINHQQGPFPPTPAGMSADGCSRFCFVAYRAPVEGKMDFTQQHLYILYSTYTLGLA